MTEPLHQLPESKEAERETERERQGATYTRSLSPEQTVISEGANLPSACSSLGKVEMVEGRRRAENLDHAKKFTLRWTVIVKKKSITLCILCQVQARKTYILNSPTLLFEFWILIFSSFFSCSFSNCDKLWHHDVSSILKLSRNAPNSLILSKLTVLALLWAEIKARVCSNLVCPIREMSATWRPEVGFLWLRGREGFYCLYFVTAILVSCSEAWSVAFLVLGIVPGNWSE